MRDMYSCLPFHTFWHCSASWFVWENASLRYRRTADDCCTTGALLTQWSTANSRPHLCTQHYTLYEDGFTYPQLEWFSKAYTSNYVTNTCMKYNVYVFNENHRPWFCWYLFILAHKCSIKCVMAVIPNHNTSFYFSTFFRHAHPHYRTTIFSSGHTDLDYKTMVFYSAPLLWVCDGHYVLVLCSKNKI